MKKFLILLLFILIIFIIVWFFVYRTDNYVSHQLTIVLPDEPGLPLTIEQHPIVQHDYYTLSYNEQYEQADWVMYRLSGDSLKGDKFRRKNDFRKDTLITTESATLNDYKRSGYDRGHLCPAADMSWSETALSETFYMSNMSPQKPRFNRGIWKHLEAQVRKWATINNEVYVITGPVFQDSMNYIGNNKVAVPKLFYKVNK